MPVDLKAYLAQKSPQTAPPEAAPPTAAPVLANAAAVEPSVAPSPTPTAPKKKIDLGQYLINKSGAGSDALLEGLNTTPIKQEMHPDFTTADRLVVKNFTNDNEAAVNYLQKRHPDLEISVDKNLGQIVARKKDGSERDFRVLDPENNWITHPLDALSNPVEMLRDAGDVAYDIGSGVVSNAATAIGGVMGAAGGAGIGALPAAAAAGGLSSGALEYLRQGIGKALGVDQKIDNSQALAAGAGGALAPVLFGTGSNVASKAARAFLPEETLTAAAAREAANPNVYQGMIGKGVDKFVKPGLAKAGGFLSGTSEDALSTAAARNPEFTSIINDPEGRLKLVEKAGEQVDSAFRAKKAEAFQEFSNAIGDFGDKPVVDTTPVKEALQNAISDAEERAAAGGNTGPSKEILTELKAAYNRYFKGEEKVLVPGPAVPTGVLDAAGNPIMTAGKAVEEVVPKEVENLSPKAAIDLSRRLGEMADYDKIDPRALSGSHLKGASATDKEIATVGSKLKKILDESIDSVVPENALPARRKLGELINLEKDVNRITKNPQTAFTNFRNADIGSNINSDILHRVDRLVGTNLQGTAKMAEAVELLGPKRKSNFAGGLKRTPAGLAGAAAGGYLGSQSGDGKSSFTGGLAGGALGLALGSPAAMRAYIRSGLLAGRGLDILRSAGGVYNPAQILERKAVQEGVSPWLGVTP